MVMAHCFLWETIPEHGSCHLPLSLVWDKDIKVKRVRTRRRPIYPIADWPFFHKCLDNSIHAVLSVMSLSRRLESVAIPIKAVRKREIPWMNAQLKQLIQKRNELRRNLRTNRKQWLETNRVITRLTVESKRAPSHWHLDRIFKPKDAKQSWSTVRSLSGKESHTTGKSLLYRGRVYASFRSKASAFIQDYSEIGCLKNDRDSRKAVMDLRCITRSTRTTPWLQIEETFTSGELQQTLSHFKAWNAAGLDGMTHDLLRTSHGRGHQFYWLSLTAAVSRAGDRNPGARRTWYNSLKRGGIQQTWEVTARWR